MYLRNVSSVPERSLGGVTRLPEQSSDRRVMAPVVSSVQPFQSFEEGSGADVGTHGVCLMRLFTACMHVREANVVQ
jgi:hypothetical protein